MNFRLIRKRTEPAFVEPMRCNPVTTLTDLLGVESVLDGELVNFNSQGRPSLQLLQSNLSRTLPVYFYSFDLLNRDGELLVNLPIERRRELLGSMFSAAEDPLRLSPSSFCKRLRSLEFRLAEACPCFERVSGAWDARRCGAGS
jgi:ATP-dependent DNA ligase